MSPFPTDETGRRLHDAYYTPDALALAAVHELDLPQTGTVLEPSVGGGAWVRAIREWRPQLVTIGCDVQASAAGLREVHHPRVIDFLELNARKLRNVADVGCVDWVIGNPPFKDAQAHVEHALSLGMHVAMLLRVAFLAGSERYHRLYRTGPRPARVLMCVQRPSFLGGVPVLDKNGKPKKSGTDPAQEYAVIVWHRGHAGPTELSWLSWRPDGRTRGGTDA